MSRLVNIKETGLLDQWADSIAVSFFDGKIHLVGQATHAIEPANLHYIFDTDGTRVAKFNGPFGTRGEASLSKLLSGKLVVFGGTTQTDIWQFDPTIAGNAAGSWSLLNVDFSGDIGPRIMAKGIDFNGWFYVIGGWNEPGESIYKTQDFQNWTLVGTVPDEMKRISAFGCCVFKGKIYCIGGGTNMEDGEGEEHYESELNGRIFTIDEDDSIEILHQDQFRFGSLWLDAVATDDYIFVSKGYISQQQASQFPEDSIKAGLNQRGLMRSADGITWEDMSLFDGLAFYFERHVAGAVAHDNIVYLMAGYQANGMWKIIED